MGSLILMSALEDRIKKLTGDISASMTTTNSIMSENVWQIKDGICITKLMDLIASKAINKEAVMFHGLNDGIINRASNPIAWARRNGYYIP